MRRFLTLVCLLCVAIPAGISITGCTRNPGQNYCNGLGYGLKVTDVASITLQPQVTGLSMAYGQTRQISAPFAVTCKGGGAIVNTKLYTYGTTNNQLLDISPSGEMCAGTWNRNTGGGIPDYTYCNFPNPAPKTNGLPYGVAYVTASINSVVSNPVEVFVHPQVTSISLVSPQQCFSQSATEHLDSQACIAGPNGTQQLLCAPAGTTTPACPLPAGQTLASMPSCSSAIGTLTYSVGTASVATINTDTNDITAELPGTTAITASVAGSGSSAGYFSTCPPKSIQLTLANGATSGTITKGVQQNLTTTVLDTNSKPITGLTLDYQSTNPINITASGAGTVTTLFPGQASVYAICQPGICDPAPINVLGINGTGLSIASNPVAITTPGTASQYAWFSSPGQSQYFASVQVLTGTVSSTVRLPYVPNSMVMDATGTNLYFGSAHELMIYSTLTNTLTKQDVNVPGVVLAASPNAAQLLINDPIRHVFYIYSVDGGTFTTFGGLGASAQWTPDSKTLYVVDNSALNNPSAGITGHTDTLYVYDLNTGWSTYDLTSSNGAQSLALMVPGVGAYMSGASTVAHTWCPAGTVGNNSTIQYYPLGDTVPVPTDVLSSTSDGKHILGAAMVGGGVMLDDIGVTIPSQTVNGVSVPIACPTTTAGSVQTMQPLTIQHTLNQVAVSAINATSINQVVSSPASNLAFITYNGSTPGAKLPYYVPGATSPGYVTLAGSNVITAPLTGAFSPDDSLFFVSTAGDNQVHFINLSTLKDTQQITPNLPACTPVSAGGVDAGCTYSGNSSVVPVTAIAVKPRSTT